MCGLSGYLDLHGKLADSTVLRAMNDALAHRGPDGQGLHVDGPMGLAHRRLAIIDLSPASAQPMISADGRHALAYNGEVYNFHELRRELERAGHCFRTSGDVEVVLASLVEWGVAALSRFNGMFALAWWDAAERRLVLARDRFGVKPLYYTELDGAFAFGSEIKSLLRHPACRAAMDCEGLVEYLTFQNFFSDRTLFRGVRLLPPGCALVVRSGQAPRLERYWDFDFRPDTAPPSWDEAVEELDALFTQAVRRQLVADTTVGTYLSGGLDTGAIATVAARTLGSMRSFTIGFDLSSASGLELGFDERAAAEHISYLAGTEQYEMVLKAGDMERCLGQLVHHLEEPRVGQSYPNFYAAKLASKFDKVVLSGTGGDELFGGYPWRYYRASAHSTFESFADDYYAYWQRLLPSDVVPAVFAPIWGQMAHVDTRAIFCNVFANHASELTRPEDYINHCLYFEAKTFLHGLLVVEDKLSMACGLETRVPFLDNDLVDFAMRLPVSFKLGNLGDVIRLNENEPGAKAQRYFERTRDGKKLLREAMRRHVPDSVSQATKQGFSGPDASWFRGESIEFVRRLLLNRDDPLYDFVAFDVVQGLLHQHLAGQENRRLLVWSLLYLSEWCRRFLGPGAEGGENAAAIPPTLPR